MIIDLPTQIQAVHAEVARWRRLESEGRVDSTVAEAHIMALEAAEASLVDLRTHTLEEHT